MFIQEVKKYLSSNVKLPYFLFTGDEQYNAIMEKLSESGFTFVRISDYCSSVDKLPDIDGLFECLKTADMNRVKNKLVVIGLGEYLALCGNVEAKSALSQLKDLNIGNAKVVLLLRGIETQISILKTDLRFDNRRYSVTENTDCEVIFTLASSYFIRTAINGIKNLLKELENGLLGSVFVSTKVKFDKALFTVHTIKTAYDGIKIISPSFKLPITCGSEKQWNQLLTEMMENNNSLDSVLKKYEYDINLETDLYKKVSGVGFRNWFYFIALKSNQKTIINKYLCFVLDSTKCFEKFKSKLLNDIIEVHHTDKQFETLYSERKKLVEKFSESDIANFVVNNRKNISESIFKLTDGTKTEREEIVSWVSQNGIIQQIDDIYPSLADYLKKYTFNCGELSELFTKYFDDYKRQKVSNNLKDDFIKKVEELAKSRDYNRLPTRNEIIDGLEKTDTYLYWLDALGVEYLAFISELVRIKGLSISIKIARAELPSITSFNKDFFTNWQGKQKEKNDDLDETKHKSCGGYNFENNDLPIHLAKELDIVSAVIERAATKLTLGKCKRFLIVSDHGASRLAVLMRKEEKYETDTKGEHSGRCCKLFKPYDLPFAAEENGYLVLADYGRFKGSRAANVEVHGGASLEEVVVPIIELTLKNRVLTVELVDKFVTVDFRTGTEIILFFNFPVENVTVRLNKKEKLYLAKYIDTNRYKVLLQDIKKAGHYTADVYAGDDLIGKVQINAQGKSSKINDTFDDLF